MALHEDQQPLMDGDKPADPYNLEDSRVYSHLTGRITHRFGIARRHRWRLEREWLTNCFMDAGVHWVVWDRAKRTIRSKKLPPWWPRPVTNKYAEHVESNVSSLIEQKPSLQWYPLTQETENVAAAEHANKVDQIIAADTSRDQASLVIARWAAVTGDCYVENYWETRPDNGERFIQHDRCGECGAVHSPTEIVQSDHQCPGCGGRQFSPAKELSGCGCPRTGEVFPPEMTGQPSPAAGVLDEATGQAVQDPNAPPLEPIFEGEPIGKQVPIGRNVEKIRSPFEVFYNPSANDFHGRFGVRWVIILEMVMVEEMLEQYGPSRVPEVQASSTGTRDQSINYLNTLHVLHNSYFSLGNTSQALGTTTGADLGERVVRETYYQLPDERYPEGMLAVRLGGAGGRIMEAGPLPYHDTDGRPFIPVAHYRFRRQNGRISGRTPMSDVARLQDTRNSTEAMMIVAERRMSNGGWILPKGVTEREPTGEPGEHVWYRHIDAGGGRAATPQRFEGQNPAIYYQWRLQDLDSRMEEAAGNFGVAQGDPPAGVVAASALAYLGEKQQKRAAPQTNQWELFNEERARQQMFIFREYADETHYLPLMAGHDNEWTVEAYSKADLNGRFNVKVESGSALPKSNAQLRATIDGELARGILDISDPVVVAHIHREFGTEHMVGDIMYDLRDVRRENDRFMRKARGEELPYALMFRPDIDNHQMHAREHVRLAKTDDFEKLEQRAATGDDDWAKLLVTEFYQHLEAHLAVIEQQRQAALIEAANTKGQGSGPNAGRPTGAMNQYFGGRISEPEGQTRAVLEPPNPTG